MEVRSYASRHPSPRLTAAICPAPRDRRRAPCKAAPDALSPFLGPSPSPLDAKPVEAKPIDASPSMPNPSTTRSPATNSRTVWPLMKSMPLQERRRRTCRNASPWPWKGNRPWPPPTPVWARPSRPITASTSCPALPGSSPAIGRFAGTRPTSASRPLRPGSPRPNGILAMPSREPTSPWSTPACKEKR